LKYNGEKGDKYMFRQIRKYIVEWLMSGTNEDGDLDGDIVDLVDLGEEMSKKQPEHDCAVTLDDREFIGNWKPPARYCVHTTNIDIWCDEVKPSLMSIDLYYTLKIGGVDRVVCASLSDTIYIIFDYEATQTPKAFDNAPKTNIDSIIHVKQEETDQEEAKMSIERVRPIPQDTGVASAYA
jgi:hypothetical protein